MFQRFKEASSSISNFVDQLADEQNKLRAQQASAQGSNAPNRRPNPRARPSTPSQSKPARPSSDDPDKNVNLTGPDPDPALFEGPTAAEDKDDGKQEVDGQQPRPSAEGSVSAEKTVVDASTGDGSQDGSKAQEQEKGQPTPLELPEDVQAKLRKLAKLEGKYQDLLKAYRRAHARNAIIEPFEARLREHTPLTSILDPAAFVEYISQLGTKGDMVMQELKNVSSEKDDLKRKLDEAEQKTRDAYDEISRLKEPVSAKEDTTNSDRETNGKTDECISQDPAGKTGEEMFSVDAEVPRLEAELEERRGEIIQLNVENGELKRNLEAGKESAEQMMNDLEVAKKELESVQNLQAQTQSTSAIKCQELETKVVELESQLAKGRTQLEALRTTSGESEEQQKREQQTLQATITKLESDISASREQFETSERHRDELEDAHKAETAKLEQNIATMKTRVQEAERESRHLGEKVAVSEAVIAQLRLQNRPTAPVSQTAQNSGQSTPVVGEASASKKKNNKKKNKQKAVPTTSIENETPAALNGEEAKEEATTSNDLDSLQSRFDDCMTQLVEKNVIVDRLEKKLRDQEDLIEEIESLREELLSIGQEHVAAKDKLVQADNEQKTLKQRIVDLESELTQARETQQTSNADMEGTLASLKAELLEAQQSSQSKEAERAALEAKVKDLENEMSEHEEARISSAVSSAEVQRQLESSLADLRVQTIALRSDLTAAEQLAASRFKEMTILRDVLQKAQPELVSLRAEVVELRKSRDELNTKAKELRRLELREETLRQELETIRIDVAVKDQEIKNLNQKLSNETSQRFAMEETQRRSQRDMQRLQQDKTEASQARESLSKELEQAIKHLAESRSRLDQFQQDVDRLTRDASGLREEISLKTAQHASAEILMTSVRDQAGEMGMQLKEAKERCESLEEELTDAHRLMGERGRENETMRRLLADVETRSEARVKEMRDRMDLALQERDRAEEDAGSIGRRKTREIEDVRNRLRGLERDLKRATEDKEELQSVESDLRQQKTENDRRLDQSKSEAEEVRKAMSELRDALDEGERQVRDFEVERNELKRSLEELQQQADKLQKSNKTLTDELRSARATRMRPTDSPVQSTRSSFESLRPNKITSPTSPRIPSFSPAPNVAMDYVYLKNVLLQFLEQKDKGHQKQLVPVLGMLLHFDKKDEQKWMTAINNK